MTTLERLERLHALHGAGALTSEEFEREKAKLLTVPDVEGSWEDQLEEGSAMRLSRLLPIAIAVIVAGLFTLGATGLLSVPQKTTTAAVSDGNSVVVDITDAGKDRTDDAPTGNLAPQTHDAASAPPTAAVADELDAHQNLWPAVAGMSDQDLARAPAEPFVGPRKLPTFDGGQKRFSTFESRFQSEAKKKPNFAGHYRIIDIGCGAQCTFNFILDEASGVISELSIGGDTGGESSLVQDTRFFPTSKMLYAVSADSIDDRHCIYSRFEWDGAKLVLRTARREALPADQSNAMQGCAS